MRHALSSPGGRRGLAIAAALLAPLASLADSVPVAHWEGLAHGFVVLRSLEGVSLADGDLIQTTRPTSNGNRVTARLVLRFKDGSVHEETTTYVQRRTFRLVTNHVVQKGPAFKRQLESTLSASGDVTVRYTDEDGKPNTIREHLDLPPDVANGMILAVLKNIDPKKAKTTLSIVAITPKPRLVKLEITPLGEEAFSTADTARKAMHYVVKVDIPGLTGAVASVLGKTPPDSHVWVLGGNAPAFVKAEWPLFSGGPLWRIEQVSPVWPSASGAPASGASHGGVGSGRR